MDHPETSSPSPRRALRVAVLQATGVTGDHRRNLQTVRDAAGRARSLGCDLLVTPELFVSGYAPADVCGDDGRAHREALARIAAQTRIGLVASTVDAADDGPAPSICASLFDDGGRELTRYAKQRLFGPDEQRVFAPGRAAPEVVSYRGVATALGICFDVEFPEFVRDVAARGADLLCVPTAVPVRDPGEGFDVRRVATLLVPARAMENGLFIAYADHHGPVFAGLSSITDPCGSQVALADEAGPALLVADVDTGDVRSARAATPYLDIARTPLARALR